MVTSIIHKKKRFLWYFVLVFLCFFFLYQCNLTFLGLPDQLHSSRISAILLVSYSLLKWSLTSRSYKTKRSNRIIKGLVIIFLLLFFYSLLILFYIGPGTGNHIVVHLINIFLFAFPVLWAFTYIFDDLDDFLYILLVVGLIQSAFIVACIVFPDFSLILDYTVNYTSNEDYEFTELRQGYAGGVGCITSAGVIKYSISMIAAIYFYLKTHKIKYFFYFVVMAILATMVARTGLIIDAVYVIILFIGLFIEKRVRRWSLFLASIAFLFLISFSLSYDSVTSVLDERYQRYEILKEDKGSGFFDNYFHGQNSSVPPINGDTMMGVGVLSGKSGNGYYVNVDGGYLRTYSAVGLFICVFFYFVLFRNMYQAKRVCISSYEKILFILFIFTFLLGEFKEPIILGLWPIAIYYAMLKLLEKQHIVNHEYTNIS